ncbi:MAG: GIY-YIG nuclease family protein [Vicinamibacteria bacterium]
MGVFRVHNTVSDKSFVGSSRDLPSVLNRERFWLNGGGHPNRALQEDWNRHGPGAFVFETLDTLSPGERSDSELADDLALLERLWLEKLTPYGDRGYNPPSAADSPASRRQE